MNIVLNMNNVLDHMHNIKILDKKGNNIFDGDFAKIIYSDENVSLNGLYINVSLQMEKYNETYDSTEFGKRTQNKFNRLPFQNYKNILYFQPNHSDNIPMIQQITRLEKQIIDYYKEYMNSDKTPLYALHTQLISGSTKYYRETYNTNHTNHTNQLKNYVIKISGIWESATTIGITYKFIEMY